MTCRSNGFVFPGNLTLCDDGSLVMTNVRTEGHAGAASHLNTTDAFRNCLTSPPAVSTIIGEGISGAIFTGAGNSRASDVTKFISVHNLGDVVGSYNSQSPKGASRLLLAGCDVATGTDGQDLLNGLVASLGIEVWAPSGAYWPDPGCGHVYFEKNAGWVKASPGTAAPFHAPPGLPVAVAPADDIWITVSFAQTKIAAKQVQEISLATKLPWKESSFHEWSKDVPQVLRYVHLDQPFEEGPRLPAVQTGLLEIMIEGREGPKAYRVFNNRLLQDTERPTFYYYINVEELIGAMLA